MRVGGAACERGWDVWLRVRGAGMGKRKRGEGDGIDGFSDSVAVASSTYGLG